MNPILAATPTLSEGTRAPQRWSRWCCPLHFMSGAFSPDRSPRLAAAGAPSGPPPSLADITPKERSSLCRADASLTAGLYEKIDRDRALVFRNARVITMLGTDVLTAHDVVVRNARIEAVQPTGSSLPADAVVVDATGRTLMPGLSDIHAHPMVAGWAQAFAGMVRDGGDGSQLVLPYELQLFELLACGITRIEVMAGCPDALWMRDGVKSGTLVGPTMTVGSPIVDGAPIIHSPLMTYGVGDLEGGRRAGEQLADMGFDFAKPYSNLPAEGYEGLMEVCQRRGVRVMGHVPIAVGVEAAIRRGQQGIAHVAELFYNERGPERRDAARRERLVRLMAEHGTWLHGTAAVSHRIEVIGGRLPMDAPDWDHMSTLHKALLAPDSPLLAMYRNNPDKQYLYDETYALSCQSIAAAHRAGVRVLTGTDYPNPTLVAGHSLHEELVRLTQHCGLVPHEALHNSTRLAAQYHGEGAADGTVSVGGRADLLLLDADPLQDIHATRRIQSVLAGQHLLREPALRDGFARIKAAYAAMPPVVLQMPKLT
ncbi:imidazolonepropionase-like amidohydrolase [Roseateles toxinivorans]|uniref:Imidazolonepropionase-like amidohydrolase n=1 Tax=Roseateles toxinivorans TaxID=270368 RepID=A0A4R6QEN9_9BURK|nr:imidazolonepropionase-like amidohydrolase [Roseateles toxinivorans]